MVNNLLPLIGINLIFGTPGDDILIGTGIQDRIFGLAGDDILLGLLSDDFLIGGPGNGHAKWWRWQRHCRLY